MHGYPNVKILAVLVIVGQRFVSVTVIAQTVQYHDGHVNMK